MKITYDKEADALYFEFKEITNVVDTLTVTKDMNADVDKQGYLLGIEILNASKVTDLRELVIKDITDS